MQNQKFIGMLLGLVVLCVGLWSVTKTVEAADSIAKVTRIKGQVRVKVGHEGTYQSVNKGDSLVEGSVIKTSRKSRIEIRLADNSVIRLGSKSTLALQRSLMTADTKKVSARLWGGKAYAVVNKLVGKESSFKIRTGTAVAGVRGTAFRINAATDQSTIVRVYTGAVAVSNAPFYAKAGKLKKKQGALEMPRQGVKPGGAGRVEVSGPQEVTKKEWEELVAKAMQEIRVSAAGELSEPVAFDPAEDEADEWVAWNKSMDKQLPTE